MAGASEARSKWSRRNPRATPSERRRVRATAASVAREYAERGARAVLLAGSWARGDAHRYSDLDLWVLGNRPGTRVLWRDPFVVYIRRTTESSERRSFRDPARIGGVIPGWRLAVSLYDPRGTAARLRAEAVRFRWDDVAARCDRWVAESLVGWAEEAVKLVRALSEGQLATACVQRNLLAEALGFVVAVHQRMLWDSENGFWERVGAAVGGRWRAAQREALQGDGSDPVRSCEAALTLYAETAKMCGRPLRGEQRAVVAHTCRAIGRPLV